MLPKAFQCFLEQRPICVMAQAVLENFFQPQHLDALFERAAQRQYTRTLLFSALIDLMFAVVLCIEPSVYAAYRLRKKCLRVSDQAVYDQLDGMEVGVSAALVEDSAPRAAAVIDALGARRKPWLRGYRVRLLDGNHLSGTEHHLAVDDAGRGLLVPPLGLAGPAAQGVVDGVPQATAAPAVEVIAGGPLRGKVVGQRVP